MSYWGQVTVDNQKDKTLLFIKCFIEITFLFAYCVRAKIKYIRSGLADLSVPITNRRASNWPLK